MRFTILPMAAVVAASGSALADLDVAVSAGSPLEWSNELPFRAPILDRGPIYTATGTGRSKPEEGAEPPQRRGSTGVADKPAPRFSSEHRAFGSLNPMGAARILTLDIVGHLPWTNRTMSSDFPERLTYPPATRADLYWLTLSGFLRLLLHPAKVSEAETAQFLILVGPPTHEALTAVGAGNEELSRLCKYLEKSIAKVPPRPPDPRPLLGAGIGPEQGMLTRWAALELVSDHLFAFNPLYARRTLELGGEAIPILIACSRSEHPLLRQNAAGILSACEQYDESVLKRLREIFLGADAVARNRALEGLIRWADPEAEDALLKALKSQDRYLRIYAIHALGRMRSIRARTPLQGFLKIVHKDRGETWMAAVSALARVGDPDGKTRAALKTFLKNWRQAAVDLSTPVPTVKPDEVDPPETRSELLQQTIAIALAFLGDRDARDRLIRSIGAAGDPAAQAGPRAFRFPTDPVLGSIESFNQFLAIEALAEMGEDGSMCLKNIVNRSPDFVLQGYALAYLLRDGREARFCIALADAPITSSVLRVQAMQGLAKAEATRGDAIRIARAVVADYLKRDLDAPARERPGVVVDAGRRIPSYECLSALRLLGQHAPPEIALVLDAIAKAKARGHYAHVETPIAPVPRGGVQEMNARSFPPLLEGALLELGRFADPKAVPELELFLKDAFGPGRPEAALALGCVKTRKACAILLDALRDDDPWVRYSAYRSLKRMSGEDHFADWLFGAVAERAEAVKAWAAWLAEKGKELPE